MLFCAQCTAISSVMLPSYLTSLSTVADGKQTSDCWGNDACAYRTNLHCRAAAYRETNAVVERITNVQTSNTVTVVPQATISERACGAARLYRNSGWLSHYVQSSRCSSTREKAMHVQTQRMHWANKTNSSVGFTLKPSIKSRGKEEGP